MLSELVFVSATHLVTLFSHTAHRIAGARLTALSNSDLPVVLDAAVTLFAHHVGQAVALARGRVTRTGVRVSAQHVTLTFCRRGGGRRERGGAALDKDGLQYNQNHP